MKLTPPSPQRPLKRLKFFIDHPEFKNAKYEVERLTLRINESSQRQINRVKKHIEAIKPTVIVVEPPIETASGLFSKVKNIFKKLNKKEPK